MARQRPSRLFEHAPGAPERLVEAELVAVVDAAQRAACVHEQELGGVRDVGGPVAGWLAERDLETVDGQTAYAVARTGEQDPARGIDAVRRQGFTQPLRRVGWDRR